MDETLTKDLAGQIAEYMIWAIRENPAFGSPWMKESQAADYLGLKTRGMQTLRRQGTGPKYCMPGGVIRFHRDDLDAYMRAGEKGPLCNGPTPAPLRNGAGADA